MRRTFVASAPASTRVDGPNAELDSPTLDVAARSVSASFRDFYRKNGRMRRVLQPLAKKESEKARLGGPPRARCIGAWRASEPECSLERRASATAFWAPDPSGAPCPGSQAILLFHQPWRREGESKEKKTLRVRVTLSLDTDGKKVDGEVAAF